MMDPNTDFNQDCLGQATMSGAKAGAQAGIVSGVLYYAAMKYSPFFRNVFNASARTALAVMPIFYTGYLNIEQQMHKCMKTKERTFEMVGDDYDD